MRVLVVDDCTDNADLLAELIRRCKHEAAVAHTGQEALAIAQRFQPRLILMDISMPIMDGYETSRRLREAGVDAPIVALTAFEQDRGRLTESGIDSYQQKPLQLDALKELMGC